MRLGESVNYKQCFTAPQFFPTLYVFSDFDHTSVFVEGVRNGAETIALGHTWLVYVGAALGHSDHNDVGCNFLLGMQPVSLHIFLDVTFHVAPLSRNGSCVSCSSGRTLTNRMPWTNYSVSSTSSL